MESLQIPEWIVFPHIYRIYGGRDTRPSSLRKSHDSFEIHYMVSGQCAFFIQDRVYAMKPGDVAMVGMDAIRYIDETEEQERIVMVIHPSVMEWFIRIFPNVQIPSLFTGPSPLLRLSHPMRGRVEQVLTQMIEESASREEGWESIYRTLLAQFFALIRRAREHSIPAEGASRTRTHEKLAQICRCIRDQYARPLTLEAVAGAYDVSPCYLSRIFKKITGMPFSRYRNEVRIHHAKSLLAQSRMPVSAVAEQCGFESATHFGRVFKELMATTPLKYRKAYQHK
jgi:AraC-like DNA-binding protein